MDFLAGTWIHTAVDVHIHSSEIVSQTKRKRPDTLTQRGFDTHKHTHTERTRGERRERVVLQRMPTIVNETLRGSQFLAALDDIVNPADTIFSATIVPHFLFDCVGKMKMALIIVFINNDESLHKALDQLEKVQRSFKHSCGVIVTKDESYWRELNVLLRGGMMRIVWAQSFDSSAELVKCLYQDLCSPASRAKLVSQKEYFNKELRELLGEHEASKVYETSLQALNITLRSDVAMLKDGFPSIKELLAADLQTLSRVSPVDEGALSRIANFFHPKSMENMERPKSSDKETPLQVSNTRHHRQHTWND